ncbi:beta-lactamase hydrolase domain-containing protein [Aerolutibacter ruishenii]|uniref:Uncharacterized protein (TIGR01244 family) n=1 Tax=Aerolutibacter ruishenii TaxID=686800 RepID=A0A562LK28_9GAMM|nr:sulfur transferase domain-containing protein [Lysobacter ruishenii]TWI07967.1 uncharacterized protein (TIGR01244 family) [Lysobacter ruishenii]
MTHRMNLRVVTLGLLAAALTVACSSAPDTVASTAPAAAGAVGGQSVAGPQLAGLRQPSPGLYTGGQPTADAWGAMAAAGVGTVINLRPDAELAGRDEAGEVRAAGMAYHQIPVAGAGDLTAENADKLWTLLQQAKGPVVVHCASGNRVGGLLSIAMARHGGLERDAALQLGREAGMVSTEARAREVLDSADGRCVSNC